MADQVKHRPELGQLGWVGEALDQTYDRAGLFAQAEALDRQGLTNATSHFGSNDLRTAGAMAHLGRILLRQHKAIEAERLLQQCLTIRELQDADAWTTFNTRALLGGALLDQKRYPEAAPLLLAGYAGMKQREDKIPSLGKPRLKEALQQLVQLYEATGPSDQAAQWKQKLRELDSAVADATQPAQK